MKGFTVLTVVLGLIAAPAAFADPAKRDTTAPQPVVMSDAQLDRVTAGVEVAIDTTAMAPDSIDVVVPVAASVAVEILGTSTAVASRPGRVR